MGDASVPEENDLVDTDELAGEEDERGTENGASDADKKAVKGGFGIVGEALSALGLAGAVGGKSAPAEGKGNWQPVPPAADAGKFAAGADASVVAKPVRKLDPDLLKQLPEISISEDKFDKLGEDVADALKIAKVKRISVVDSPDGKLLLLEFSEAQSIDNDPASGCRKIMIADKVTAQLKQTKEGALILDNVKGLTAEVDPGRDPYLGIPLPWVTAIIKKIEARQTADGAGEVEVTGTASGLTRGTVISVPDTHDGRIEEMLAKIKDMKQADQKELSVQDDVRKTAHETNRRRDESSLLERVLIGLAAIAAAYVGVRAGRRLFGGGGEGARPLRDATGAGEHAFKELPKRLQEKLPTEFNPDVKDALERTLEAKRKDWTPEVAAEFKKLADAYAAQDPAAVKKVHDMLTNAPRGGGAPERAVVAPGTATVAADAAVLSRQQHTPELVIQEGQRPPVVLETFTTADGIKFLRALPISEMTVAKVQEKMDTIDKEVKRAREAGLHEYAEELKRLQHEYADKKTPDEREAFCKDVMARMKEAHDNASGAGKARPGGIAGKAGTTVAVLLVAGWLMDVTAPPSVAQPRSQRVMPGKQR